MKLFFLQFSAFSFYHLSLKENLMLNFVQEFTSCAILRELFLNASRIIVEYVFYI
jgi:hypothetical protein